MSGFIPQEIINQVIEQTDIVPVVEQYVKLSKKSSANYFGLCPFHSETNASFSVSPGKQIYYCFSCQKGGNVIKFLQDIENITFPEAVRMLAQRLNLEIPVGDSKQYQENQTERKIQQNLHLEAVRFFYRNLESNAGKPIKEYMRKRGFSAETLKKFGIGYADPEWNSLANYLTEKGFTEEQMLASGIIRKSSRNTLIDLFRDRVMIPIFPSHGRYVIGFGGRAIKDDNEPKYINSPETILYHKSKNLFAMNLVRKLRPIPETLIISEGYMDVMALHQAGFPNTVASLGTALTEEQARLIDRYAKKIVIAYDSDQAGINATIRAIEIFEKFNLEIKVLDFGDFKDPDNYIIQNGKARFEALVNEAISALDFQINLFRINSRDSSGELDLNRYTAQVAELLAKLDSAIMIEVYAKRLADEINVSSDTILFDINRVQQQNEQKQKQTLSQRAVSGDDQIKPELKGHKIKQRSQAEEKKYIGYQWLLLALLSNSPDLFSSIDNRFVPDLFSSDVLKELAERLRSSVINQQISIQTLVSWTEELNEQDTSTDYNKQLLPILMALDDDQIRTDQDLLLDVLGKLEYYTAQNKQSEILMLLQDKEINNKQREQLLKELSEINKKISLQK